MSLKIFNTRSGKKEDFFPLMEREVRVYSLRGDGYDSFHIAQLDENRILLVDIPGGTEWKVKRKFWDS
jgi:cysteinyl-tRNA synthetase